MKNAKTLKWLLTLACLLAALCAFTLAANAEIVSSGTCGAEGDGSNLTWTLDDAGTLTISGSGKMQDYTIHWTGFGDNPAPWGTSIKKAVLQSGVLNIGEYSFSGCLKLTQVTIPNSVTSIGPSAFFDCLELIQVTIPDSVTTIEESAFYECIGLTSMTIPDSVTSIGGWAFYGCSGLTSVTIPNSVTSIGEGAFSHCSGLTQVTIPNSVTSIESDVFSGCSGLTSVTIPDSVTSIEEYAFYGCASLTSVTIPDGVTSIEPYTFNDCTGLTSMTISDSVTSIGDYAFSGCTGLTSMTISDSVTSIGRCAFSGCTSLSSVTIPNGMTSIGASTFEGFTGLTHLTIPDSVTSIGNRAFYGCTGLMQVTIPNSVISIGVLAFSDCTKLMKISVDTDNAVYFSKGNCVIHKESKKVVFGCKNSIIPTDGSVTSIGGGAFYCCTELTNVMIPDSVTSIGEYSFYGCTGLSQMSIPNSVITVGEMAFFECTGLTSVTVPDSVMSIGNYAIPSQTTIIGAEGSAAQTYTYRNRNPFRAMCQSAHTWDSEAKINMPTCDTAGAKLFQCTICGATKNEIIPSTGHNYGAWTKLNDAQHQRVCANDKTHVEKETHMWNSGIITTAATCTKNGVRTFTCTVCGATKTETVSKTGHNYGIWTKLNDSQHQRICANDISHVEKENHVWNNGEITTAATCTTDGVKTYTCAVCNGTKTEMINAIGHNYSAWTKLNDTQHHRVCANDNTHVEMANHKWDSCKIIIAATCTKDGMKTYTCTVCNATKTETIPATGHSYGAWTKLNETQHQRVCANDKTHIEKANHAWDGGKVTTPATCTKDGMKTYTCTVCNATKTETIHATGHSYGAWAKLNDTQHQRVCANDSSHVEKENHTWDEGTITIPSTCKAGAKTYTCTVCNATKTETIPAIRVHKYEWVETTPATCTKDGIRSYQCVNCGDLIRTETIPTIGEHAYDWVKTTPATCTKDGVRSYQCINCGDLIRTETLPATGHDWSKWTKLNATQHQRICANDSSHVENANHTWNNGTVTTAATCTTDGVKTYTCTLCSATKTETIKTTGHDWSDGVITKTPTADSFGEKTFTCNKCGAIKTEVVPKISSYTVTYDANGGVGTPSAQMKTKGEALTLSAIIPSKSYTISYNANGGSVSPASKSVSCSFESWNTERNGTGTSYAPGAAYTAEAVVTLYAQWTNPTAGTLAIPYRSGYSFDGWYTTASGGSEITATSVITSGTMLFAHWSLANSDNIYNFGEETYGFENYGDSDSRGGHCFGMSISSSAYYMNFLDISKIGLNSCKDLNKAELTATVKTPICYYQSIQGTARDASTVAGGSWYLYNRYDTTSDWDAVVNYVKDHSYDNQGSLQVGIRNETGGHAINFLRYENVNGQDRIYVYDNNFPNQETYLYKNPSGTISQAPVATFDKPIRCVVLRDVRKYFENAKAFDATHAIYVAKGQISIEGLTYSYLEGTIDEQEYVMYEIPEEQKTVKITPLVDNADFVYLDTEYGFGEINDIAYGEFTLATMNEGAVTSEARLIIHKKTENVPGDVDGDGKITAADARLALRASVDLKEKDDVTEGSSGYLACDVDGDNKVTSADARLILRASVGLEDASKFGKKA